MHRLFLVLFGLFFAGLAMAQTGAPPTIDPAGRVVTLIPSEQKGARRVVALRMDWFACHPPSGQLFRVPAGFVTDFASVPESFWGFAAPWGDWNEAATLHDWMYAVGEPGQRKHADDVFLWTMRNTNVEEAKAKLMYEAVRRFGEDGYGLSSDWMFKAYTQGAWRRVPAPFSKPQHAWVAIVNCDTFHANVEHYRRIYASRPAPPSP